MKKLFYYLFLVSSILFTLSSCDEDPAPTPYSPKIQVEGISVYGSNTIATDVSENSLLNGYIFKDNVPRANKKGIFAYLGESSTLVFYYQESSVDHKYSINGYTPVSDSAKKLTKNLGQIEALVYKSELSAGGSTSTIFKVNSPGLYFIYFDLYHKYKDRQQYSDSSRFYAYKVNPGVIATSTSSETKTTTMMTLKSSTKDSTIFTLDTLKLSKGSFYFQFNKANYFMIGDSIYIKSALINNLNGTQVLGYDPNYSNQITSDGRYNIKLKYTTIGQTWTYKITKLADVPPTGVTITTYPAVSLQKNSTFTFKATVAPESTSNTAVNWSSSNTSIVSINYTTGVAEALSSGTVTITATSTVNSAISGTKTVTVEKDKYFGQVYAPGASDVTFKSMYVNGNTVIAVGNSGRIIKSSDGGNLWKAKESGTSKNLNGISFSANNTGFIVGNGAKMLTTFDDGETWTDVPKAKYDPRYEDTTSWNYNDIKMLNRDFSIIIGEKGKYRRSWDDGWSWQSTEYMGMSEGVRIASLGNYIYVTGPSVEGGSKLKKTSDGITWSDISYKQTMNFKNLNAVQFFDSDNGIQVGQGGLILATLNGGVNWQIITSPTTEELKGLYFFNRLYGYICGTNGAFYKTIDGGVTWTKITTSTTATLYSVYFPSVDKGFICGDNGIYRFQ